MDRTWAMRHPWTALVAWIALLVGMAAAAATVGGAFYDDHSLPGAESQQVADRLQGTGDAGLDTVQVVFAVESGEVTAAPGVVPVLDEITGLPGVRSVEPPSAATYSVAEDGRTGFATVVLDTAPLDTDPAEVREILEVVEAGGTESLQVAATGDAVRAAEEGGGGAAEGIGILAALVILVLLFGSLLAASLPIVSAVLAVGSSIGAAVLVSHLVDVPTYAAPMMALVGLGVGIDYALLIFTRYRSELLAGRDHDAAAVVAQRTAGRSVLFAGATVIVALLGLVVLGLGSLRGLAVAVAVTVLATVLASATLLPALLTLSGRRLERSVRRRATRRTARGRRAGAAEGDGWRRLSDAVGRRPVAALLAGMVVLLALAAPATSIRLGFADAGTDAPDATSRQAHDLLAKGFGAGSDGPLVVLAEASGAEAAVAVDAIRRTPGVAEVAGPIPTDEAGVWTLLAFGEAGPSDAATVDLVDALRTDTLADLPGGFAVGGPTAAAIDFSGAVADRMPWFVLVVVGVSTLLLMVVFRSVLVPLKAAVLNVASIGAALGVMQLVYGFGTFGQQAGPIEAFLPVIVFAVVFGLSMDYEVFLVSRMHEEWRRTGDARLAVREGLATTGTVITAAAAIMVVVFGSFMASPDRMLGQMGLGLATAVLVDAVVVRCLLVPAFMHLVGAWAWWLPGWLDRALPHVRLEDPGPAPPASWEREAATLAV